MLTDGQVGIFKDRSASAMSTFGDILPAQAAGLLSSFTTARADSWLSVKFISPLYLLRCILYLVKRHTGRLPRHVDVIILCIDTLCSQEEECTSYR